MRCNSCNKFVSFNSDSDPEINDATVDESGNINVQLRIVNTCADCGQELTSADLDLDLSVEDEMNEHRAECAECREQPDLSVDASASRTDRSDTHDRHGKRITNPRYQRRYYGADVVATVTSACGATFEATGSSEVQASGMEECQ